MNLNLDIKENIILCISYIIAFWVGSTGGSILQYLGNGEAIKLSRIDFLESITKYFYYSFYSYEIGIVFMIAGIILIFLMSHKVLFLEYIEKEEK